MADVKALDNYAPALHLVEQKPVKSKAGDQRPCTTNYATQTGRVSQAHIYFSLKRSTWVAIHVNRLTVDQCAECSRKPVSGLHRRCTSVRIRYAKHAAMRCTILDIQLNQSAKCWTTERRQWRCATSVSINAISIKVMWSLCSKYEYPAWINATQNQLLWLPQS